MIGKVTRDRGTNALGDTATRHDQAPFVGWMYVAAQGAHVCCGQRRLLQHTHICISLGPQECEMPGSQGISSQILPTALRLLRLLATRRQPSLLTARSFTTHPVSVGHNAYEPSSRFSSVCGRLCSHLWSSSNSTAFAECARSSTWRSWRFTGRRPPN